MENKDAAIAFFKAVGKVNFIDFVKPVSAFKCYRFDFGVVKIYENFDWSHTSIIANKRRTRKSLSSVQKQASTSVSKLVYTAIKAVEFLGGIVYGPFPILIFGLVMRVLEEEYDKANKEADCECNYPKGNFPARVNEGNGISQGGKDQCLDDTYNSGKTAVFDFYLTWPPADSASG